MNTEVYWIGQVPKNDDMGSPIGTVFYDAATVMGPWAIMAHDSWMRYRRFSQLGTGFGQKYRKQVDGRWKKVEG